VVAAWPDGPDTAFMRELSEAREIRLAIRPKSYILLQTGRVMSKYAHPEHLLNSLNNRQRTDNLP
jgi:hypothetical protein